MDKCIVEYVWIDADGNLRSKNKVLTLENNSLDIHPWNFDGSSTGQAITIDSERFLKPIYICDNPFYTNGKLVLCAVYEDFSLTTPGKQNNFESCNQVLSKHLKVKPWFGFEQEYFLLQRKYHNIQNLPLGLEHISQCKLQGQFYCSVGAQNSFGRNIVDKHLKYCIKAGLSIYGTNAEVAPSQWEFQIGTVEGIEACHQLWLARYILVKVAEEFDVCVDFSPKPFEQFNGSGCHTNFSTESTRSHNGFQIIKDMMKKLELTHFEHIKNYGNGNEKRLTGNHETASLHKFSWGISSRGVTIRIGLETALNGFGYFEDRRPASNCDPYLVSMLLVKNTL